jgi:DNA-binding beta-propeller fold protein YncE
MNMSPSIQITTIAFATAALLAPVEVTAKSGIHLKALGTYHTGIFDEGASEIVAHDPTTQRVYVVNAQAARVDVLDIRVPQSPKLITSVDVTAYGAVANSVAVRNGVVAVAVENDVKTDPGNVVFLDGNLQFLSAVQVGALPDMLTFSPDGNWVLVANEGEPSDDYLTDPEGSVSIIDVSGGAANVTQADVTTAGFAAFNGTTLDASIRIYGPNATVAQDLEPEYIAVSADSTKAWVTLQENNALAVVDIAAGRVTELIGLGFKDHSLPGNGLDASDRDGAINIANWPVFGMYQPDSIASFSAGGQTYLLLANEGDSRDWDGFSEVIRVADLVLDTNAFPNAEELQENANLGRLNSTTATGDIDGDGDHDVIYVPGARSFSIRTTTGDLVYDSGDFFEQLVAAIDPKHFNASHTNNDFDNRSDDKGPEPEALTVGVAYGRTLAFIGFERYGGIAVFDVSNPAAPEFVDYLNNRNFSANLEKEPVTTNPAPGDLGPEGIVFISAENSPNGTPLLVVGNEISGTTTILEIRNK